MNFKHFEEKKSVLKFKGIIASIFHRNFKNKTYEYVVLPDVARVIAVTSDKKIILIKEKVFSIKESFFALPGGTVEEGESPIEAVIRELREETGYTSSDIEPWFDCNFSQTVISRKFYFIARNCERIGDAVLDNNEKITIEKLSYDRFVDKVLKDEFKNIEIQNIFLKAKINNKEEKKIKKLLKI